MRRYAASFEAECVAVPEAGAEMMEMCRNEGLFQDGGQPDPTLLSDARQSELQGRRFDYVGLRLAGRAEHAAPGLSREPVPSCSMTKDGFDPNFRRLNRCSSPKHDAGKSFV